MASKATSDLLHFGMARVSSEYTELIDNWKLIEAKAQANTAAAGIFVAAAFAFVKNSSYTLTITETVIFVITLISLIASILYCAWTLGLRKVPSSPGSETMDLVNAALSTDETEHEERYLGIIFDIIPAWVAINNEIKSQMLLKAKRLQVAQFLLQAALAFMALLILYSLFRPK